MEITRAGSQPSAKGPGDWFTGTVRIDPIFQAPAPARAAGAAVTFEPGARTAWHTHPLVYARRCSTGRSVNVRSPIDTYSSPCVTDSESDVRRSIDSAISAMVPRSKARIG